MEEKIVLYRADESDAENISEMMKTVYDALEDKSLFVCDDTGFVKRHISDCGFTIAARSGKNLVGCLIVRIPYPDGDNLGYDIGLDGKELMRVAHIESVAVVPDFRRRAIFGKMLEFAENIIDKNKYVYLMATVSPQNPASFKALEKRGYVHVDTRKKYGGLERRIYLKKTEV